jgi:hypothetical protein
MSELTPQKYLTLACKELNLPEATILEVHGFRWTLNDEPGLGPRMIVIERKLHELTGRPIDLRIETKDDRNKRMQRTGRSERPNDRLH